MNELLKNGGKLFLKTVVINFMSFFVVMAVISFCVGTFAETKGYSAYGTTSDSSSQELLYTYKFADGEDTKRAEYEAEGYTVIIREIRETSKTVDVITLLAAEVFTLAILVILVYPPIWKIGFADRNAVNFEHQKKDILKGLKIGCIGAAPMTLVLLFLSITKNSISANTPVATYKLMNSSLYSFIDFIAAGSTKFSQLNLWQILLLFLLQSVVPAVAFTAYYLGYKGYSIEEKFTFKSGGKTNRKGDAK